MELEFESMQEKKHFDYQTKESTKYLLGLKF